MTTKEDIIKYLKGDYFGTKGNLIITEPKDEAGKFNRMIYIETETGNKFHIEWWKNIGYLHYHGMVIPFTSIYLSSSWPNNKLLNIQGNYKNKETAFIVPIREYI